MVVASALRMQQEVKNIKLPFLKAVGLKLGSAPPRRALEISRCLGEKVGISDVGIFILTRA